MPPSSDRERIARLEQAEEDLRADISEIKADLKAVLNQLAQMTGGKRAMLGLFAIMGALISAAVAILAAWIGRSH